ncbi:hypothetical protein [Streptomyces sp. STCH 565 A]|uniref:hypothetical protein n=1 Tax=Streptomyces sp. STCH 565 A TaxID=2950532 RepID=UPI002075419A|nr:hypothetical protein [Streptomyces sp. STCH 565 A]
MALTYSDTGSRRRVFVPVPAGPVAPAPQVQDPPIYRELMRTWADGGRTLPGRHDPEWTRLAAPPLGPGDHFTTGDFTVPRGPRGDGR